MPQHRQSLLFSATFSPEIKKLAKSFLKDNPTVIEVARENSTAETVTQELFAVNDREKTDVLIDMLKTRGPEGTPLTQVLVFVNAKITCRRLARTLERVGINADAIHGDKTQEERQVALEGFKNGAIHVPPEVLTLRSFLSLSITTFLTAQKITFTASAALAVPAQKVWQQCLLRPKTNVSLKRLRL